MTLVVTDLDGTLLRSDGTLSAYSREVLAGLPVPVTCATARSPARAQKITSAAGFTAPFAGLDGAVLADPRTGDVLWEQQVDRAQVDALIEVGHLAGCPAMLVGREAGQEVLIHGPPASPAQVAFLEARRGEPRLRPVTRLRSPEHPWLVLFFTTEPDALRPHLDGLPDLAVSWSADTYVPGAFNVTVRDARADKGTAALAIAERVGTTRIVAFGDQLNDLPLFRAASHRVAVEGAHPELLALADEVCGANDEDGVATWLADAWPSG